MENRFIDKIRYFNMVYRKRTIDREVPNENITNWAIVGLGNMANRFAKALNIVPRARIVAVSSRSKKKVEQFSQKFNVRYVYNNYEEMINYKKDEIDIVYIATPVFCHYEDIKIALENGTNVLCEKPIVHDLNQLIELQKLASKNGLMLIEGMWMLYLPVYKKANQWLMQGEIGKINQIRVDLSKKEHIDNTKSKYKNKESAGVLLDYGVYTIAHALSFMSSDTKIAYCNKTNHVNGFDTNWFIVLEDEKTFANITISSTFDGSKHAAIIGECGSIVWNAQFNRTNIISLFDSNGMLKESFCANYDLEGYEYEIIEIQQSLQQHLLETETLPKEFTKNVLKIVENLKKWKSE